MTPTPAQDGKAKQLTKIVATVALFYLVGFLTLRGAMSFFFPMGMDCDAYMNKTGPCVYGPGIVGRADCIGGKWYRCEPVQMGGAR